MTNTGLSSGYVSDADSSFKKLCLHLLEMAYCEARTNCIINRDWTENAISEALKRGINDSEAAIWMYITAEVEVRQLPESLSMMPLNVDGSPRIDIKIGGFAARNATISRVCYYMEAKNLYANDFCKSGSTRAVSSTYYAKRYISTGIDHLLSGYYPSKTILLGYVLFGAIQDAVGKVNQNLVTDSRAGESINLHVCTEYPYLVFGTSDHIGGIRLEHCFLQF